MGYAWFAQRLEAGRQPRGDGLEAQQEQQQTAGKIIVITGAAGGIGRATALRFAQSGGRIAGWDLSSDAAESFDNEMKGAGGEGFYRQVNVTDAASLDLAVSAVLDRWGRIDVLINNAGIVRDAQLVKRAEDGTLTTMGEDAWDSVVDVNLKGVFLPTRAIVPQMIRQNAGVVLNAASVVGLQGNFGQTNYVATKAGVIGMTRTWARELGRYNIRVNAVAPGFIATGMVRSMPEQTLKNMVQHTPMKRLGQPEDIANAYFWLASDQASFVHGTVLSVDGGIVLGT